MPGCSLHGWHLPGMLVEHLALLAELCLQFETQTHSF